MNPISAPSLQAAASLNLRRVLVLRNIAVVGLTLAVIVMSLDMKLPGAALAVIVAVLGVLSLATWARLRLARPVTEREFFAHLLLDVLILSGLLYFTGGSTNPFTSLFLLPLTIAAVVLPARYVWSLALLTLACFSLLMFFYVPLPYFHEPHQHEHFDLHVWGMWFGFLLSAALISYFIVRMSGTLRERDAALARAREDILRSERILALGTLAAGVAHELGTPLSTMAVLAKDLESDCTQPDVQERLRILREQVERCKKILSTLSASAGHTRAEEARGVALDVYLNDIVEHWRATRPAVNAQFNFTGAQPAPRIVAEQTIAHAVTNILNNAADASPNCVEIRAQWDSEKLLIEVDDRGAGLSDAAARQAGEAFFTTKAAGQGLGLGLFLTHATLTRFGGSVQLFNRAGGGVRTQLVLPIAKLLLTP
ncbi:MAG: ATP-binding protein [Pseudomonadota bacterium]